MTKMEMEYYHNLVTKKSFELLQDFKRQYQFVLIGGWAVFLWTKVMKSKDIDIVVDLPELEKLKQNYDVTKNDRLKKYEAKLEEIDIDIYAAHYSNPGLPAEGLAKYALAREGFRAPRPEILMILKQRAYQERQGTPKGEKDKIDIFSLLALENFDYSFYKKVVEDYKKTEHLASLINLLSETREVKELNLNQYRISKLKKVILEKLGS